MSQSAVLMHVEIMLDDDDRVAGDSTKPCKHVAAVCECRRSAGPWSARRECTTFSRFRGGTSSRANLMRWASPPLSVGDGWPEL